MTSRERVLNAIDHKQSDRIPLDLGSTPSSGISAIAYNNLKKHLGYADGHTRVYDVVQQVVQVEDPIIEKFGVDVLDIGRTFNVEDDDWYDVKLADGSTAQWPSWFHPVREGTEQRFYDEKGTLIARMPDGATFFDQGNFPYLDDYPENYEGLDNAMQKVLWSRLVHSPWDHGGDPDFYKKLRSHALELRKNTDKALMIVCGCNLFEWGTFLRRMDNFLMDIYCDQENVEELLDQLLSRHLATLEKVCNAVGDVVDIIRFGDDLIDAGFEILNPIQTSARQMEPAVLKKEFGDSITFWGGGCNTRTVLNRSTPQEVYDYTYRTIETFAPNGGFVFNQEHNIMPDVPPENIVAMYKAVRDFKY